MQIRQILDAAVASLETVSDSPRLDCECLLAHILNKNRVYLMTWPEHELNNVQQQQFEQLLRQRQQGTPVAYLLGRAEFWSLSLKVDDHTLIPRPETELLVEQALSLIPPQANWQIADLGTGSGAIAIALASERPDCRFTAVDINPATLAVAQTNAQHHQLENIQFVCGSWLEPVTGKFQMIVSNPPYIAEDDPHLQQGDIRFEPRRALVSNRQGLADIEHIIDTARNYLIPPGILILEHGYDQATAVRNLLHKYEYHDCYSVTDLQGHERTSIANWQERA